jgi:transposase
LDNFATANLKTGRAYRIRLAFQELYLRTAKKGVSQKCYWWATHSRLPPMIEAARMVKRHWNGILRSFRSRIANGIIEASTASSKQPKPRPVATGPSTT